MMTLRPVLMLCLAVGLQAGLRAADEAPPVTLAVFSLEEGKQVPAGLGASFGELLTVQLAATPGLRLVERAQLDAALAEFELQENGLVAQKQLLAGQLLGAQLIVTGHLFDIGERRTAVVKLTSVETQQIAGVTRRMPRDTPLNELAAALARELAATIAAQSSRLLPSTVPFAKRAAACARRPLPPLAPQVARDLAADPAAAALDIALRQAATEAGLTLDEGPAAAPLVLSYGVVPIGRVRHRECVELSLTLTASLPGKPPEPHRRSRLVIEESDDDRPRVLAALLRETLLDLLAAPP